MRPRKHVFVGKRGLHRDDAHPIADAELVPMAILLQVGTVLEHLRVNRQERGPFMPFEVLDSRDAFVDKLLLLCQVLIFEDAENVLVVEAREVAFVGEFRTFRQEHCKRLARALAVVMVKDFE